MSTHSMDYSIEEEIIEIPLADRSSGRSTRRRSSGQSVDGSIHSINSAYSYEEVESVYSEYTLETLNDSMSSLQNSFTSFSDVPASTPPPPPPTNVSVPDDSLSDMQNYLRAELGLEIPPRKESPKKEEKKEAPKRNSALDEMKNFLRSELGIDAAAPQAARPQNSSVSASLDLSIPSFATEKNKKPKEVVSFGDSELARSIAFLKEGVDIEEIEYIMSDEEEIIDDVFDHMGGLDGRDTVLLESYGLSAIPEIAHSEYDSDIDDSVRMARASEISMLSTDFQTAIGDVGRTDDDEVDTKTVKPKPTGLHETSKSPVEKVVADTMDVDESMPAENHGSPSQKSGKAAKWKDRIKKKRRKSDKGSDDMDVDSSSAGQGAKSQEAQHTDKNSSSESKSEASKGKVSDSRLPFSQTTENQEPKDETKSKKGKEESESKSEKKESTSKDSSKSSKRGKKASKWKDRIQKKRSKTGEGNQESDGSAPNSPASEARAEVDATDAAENDLKDSTRLPIHEDNSKSTQVLHKSDSCEVRSGDIVVKVDASGKKIGIEQGNKARSRKKEGRAKERTRADNTIGEIDGDEGSQRGQSVGTTHSMRIFDDEFGSVGTPGAHLDRGSVSFDTLSEPDNEGVIYEMELKDEPELSGRTRTVSRRDDSLRSLRGVFDDELGDTASNGRSSIVSTHSSVLQELDDGDKDDDTSTSNDEGDESLISKEPSAESIKTGSSTDAGNKDRMKTPQENNGESRSSFKFELPNELLEAIHCHRSHKNVIEKQSNRDSSDILRTRNESPAEKEKDGSATYSTLPPTVEDSSRTLGEDVAEKSEAGNEIQRSATRFPGRLAPDQRVIDKATGKSTCFIAAFEMVTRHRRHEIVLKSAEIASVGNRANSNDWKSKYSRDASIGDRQKLVELLKAKPSMVTRAGRKQLVMESIEMKTPLESWADNFCSKEDDLEKQSNDTTNSSNPDSGDKLSVSSRGSGSSRVRKTSSNVSGSKSSKTDARNGSDSSKTSKSSSKHKKRSKTNGVSRSQSAEKDVKEAKEAKKSTQSETAESASSDSSNRSKEDNSKNGRGKAARSTERNDTSKTKTRKRSKTRNKENPRRSRSLNTADFLSSLKANEDTEGTSEGKDADDKGTKSKRNRTRGVRRSLSMGPMEGARAKKRKEKRNGEDNDATEKTNGGDSKEKRVGVPSEGAKPASPTSGKDHQSPEIADPVSPRAEDPNVLLSPSGRRRRKGSFDKSPKVEKTSLRRSKSSGDAKSPRKSNRKSLDKVRSPSGKKKSVDLLNSPSLRKKSVDLSEDFKHELKSPKKSRSSVNEMQSPKADKPSLRRRKSGDTKSPRNSSRKSVDKIRSPAAKKKSLFTIPDLDAEIVSPKPNNSRRRSDMQSPRTPGGKKNEKRRHSDSPMDQAPTPSDQSAFMEYYDSVREGRRSLVNADAAAPAALQVPSSPSQPLGQRKSALRRGKSDSVTEVIEEDEPLKVDDIWGLVKWRDQVDRTVTSKGFDA